MAEKRNFDADRAAIEQDLNWLENNRFFDDRDLKKDLNIEIIKFSESIFTHRYSDLKVFQRLIKTICFILHNPLLNQSSVKSQKNLLNKLCELFEDEYIGYDKFLKLSKNRKNFEDNLQQYIRFCLKKYQILLDFALRKGCFAGVGILSKRELNKVFQLLRSQSEHFEDPIAVKIYDILKERMMDSKLIEDAEPYPVRVIGTRSIVNKQYLPKQSLARKENLETLETAIREGQLLRLDYITGSGSFPDRSHGNFQVYPLQILFHNIAWYLRYEEAGGERDRHLYFERLDRLVINEKPTKKRDIKNQK
jgi:hypothetical protein